MDSLPIPFDRHAFDVFESEEINEPLLMIYQHLGLALREKSDALILKKERLEHIVNGNAVKSLPMNYEDQSIYPAIKKNLLMIFERDDLVKKHFRLEKDGENLVVNVIKS